MPFLLRRMGVYAAGKGHKVSLDDPGAILFQIIL